LENNLMPGPVVEQADELDYDDFMSDNPIKGVFFSVFVTYNPNHPQVKKTIVKSNTFLESEPLATYVQASKVSVEMAKKIKKSFKGSVVHQYEPEEVDDEYTIYIIDKKDRPIAKLGVVAEDYRRKTIH